MGTVTVKAHSIRWVLVALICGITVLAAALSSPIAQDQAYHAFGDHRHLFGVDNFWNVISNLPFVLVGLLGLHECWRQTSGGKMPHVVMYELPGTTVTFFAGVLLTGLGSAYYHLDPNNHTLIWDRLPMTISFMAFFSLIIGCHVSYKVAKIMAIPLLLAGLGSVLYWNYTESLGAGDLRPYALVQFLPILLIPVIMTGSGAKALRAAVIWKIIGLYMLAKALEHWDVQIYLALVSEMSGHAIKHVAASLATFVALLEVRDTWKGLEHECYLMDEGRGHEIKYNRTA
ncbi:ceramidase domain-containing protein [Pseudomonas amygdali]|uniref:Protein phosphatase 2C-like protein n=2 Tax=Pseudomonas amygdali pv. lachrymans TaxID=53707 RepID=A0AAD0PWT1_PSEAV|nr:ceramidase domain-containing protein [Pseudomonas amygdali]AXH60206.1 protein phosphatase 2C-like protein [Pseudomonas amygdali pv. lachrymans str. M301315]RMT06513.1 Protein phosphatase 2C-like [Pseudomonas amygdali pv. lachrymans]